MPSRTGGGRHGRGLDLLGSLLLGYEELVAAGPAVEDVRRGGDALAALMYTGGTTGFPHGVMLSHANLLTSALGSMATGGFSSWERFLHAAPMFHLASMAAFIGVSLLGATHVIVPMFDPVAVLAAIERHRVTDTSMDSRSSAASSTT